MIRFINGNKKNTDAENIINTINAYVLFSSGDGSYDTTDAYSVRDALRSMQNSLYRANSTCTIQHTDINQTSAGNRIKLLFKKTIRKLIRWYVDDTIDQQNEYNSAIVRYENEAILVIGELMREIDSMKQQMKELSKRQQTAEHTGT